jgi:hypothetical protein
MTNGGPANEATQDQLAFNPFDTADSRPEIFLTGKLSGRLASNGRCIVVEADGGSVTPLWPEGTELRRDGDRLVLSLPDGRGTAALGGRVRLGGGAFAEVGRERLAAWVASACPQIFFAVSNISE